MIDPGHAPGNANKGKNGYYEYAGMWKLSNYLKEALNRQGFVATLTRTEKEDPTLTERGARAGRFKADLLISQHTNAANGIARGVEAYHSIKIEKDKILAAALTKTVSSLMGNPDRGAKTRKGEVNPNQDYYTVIASAVTSGVPHVILIENGFHDNTQDEKFLLSDSNLKAIAETQAKVITEFFGLNFAKAETPILSSSTATVEKMQQWAKSKGAMPFFIDLAPIFYRIGISAGVNPVLAFCQSAKETAYGKFGGVLNEGYCNSCGMKNSNGGGDYDPNAHKKFDSWEQGIKAQIDHLALYAGAYGYPKTQTPDPRHFAYLFGTAKTVESLGGKWAPSITYGDDILKMINEVANTQVIKPDVNTAIMTLVKNGVINSPEYWSKKANEVEYLEQLIINMASKLN